MQDLLMSLPAATRKVFLRMAGMDDSGDGKNQNSPINSASDMEYLALAAPYLFHNIATSAVAEYNRGKPKANHIADPSAAICSIAIDHLLWWRRARRS